MAKALLNKFGFMRQRVGSRGESDPSKVLLEFKGQSKRSSSPFNINVEWLQAVSFKALVSTNWRHFEQGSGISATQQFVYNLKRIKARTKEWASEKRLREHKELLNIEQQRASISDPLEESFRDQPSRKELGRLISRRKEIITSQEVE